MAAPAPVPAPPPDTAAAAPPPPPETRVPAVPALLRAAPGEVGMDASLPSRLDALANAAIADRAASGISIAVGRWGRLVHLRGYGAVDWAPGSPAVTDSTLFDLASITKVVATTTAAAMLEEQGRLDLDQRLAWYLPGIRDTLKQLEHNADLKTTLIDGRKRKAISEEVDQNVAARQDSGNFFGWWTVRVPKQYEAEARELNRHVEEDK